MTCSPIGWIAENLERTQGPKIGNQLFILGVQIHRKYKCKEYTQLVFHVESCHVTCQLLSVFLPKYRCELLCVQWSLLQRLSATVQAYSIWLLSAQKNTWFGTKKYMIWCKFGMAIIIIVIMIMIGYGNNPRSQASFLAGASCFHQFDCSLCIPRMTSKCMDPFLLAQGGWVSIICVRHVGLQWHGAQQDKDTVGCHKQYHSLR